MNCRDLLVFLCGTPNRRLLSPSLLLQPLANVVTCYTCYERDQESNKRKKSPTDHRVFYVIEEKRPRQYELPRSFGVFVRNT